MIWAEYFCVRFCYGVKGERIATGASALAMTWDSISPYEKKRHSEERSDVGISFKEKRITMGAGALAMTWGERADCHCHKRPRKDEDGITAPGCCKGNGVRFMLYSSFF